MTSRHDTLERKESALSRSGFHSSTREEGRAQAGGVDRLEPRPDWFSLTAPKAHLRLHNCDLTARLQMDAETTVS